MTHRYGRIDGNVLSVLRMLLAGESGSQFYIVDVSMTSKLFEDNGEEVAILPVWLLP